MITMNNVYVTLTTSTMTSKFTAEFWKPD